MKKYELNSKIIYIDIAKLTNDDLQKLNDKWLINSDVFAPNILLIENGATKDQLYYTNKKMDVDVYFNLKEKAKHVIWKNENRKEKYILFSINGFTKELVELAQKEDSIILKQ